jgi:putative ABC transport system permease protein
MVLLLLLGLQGPAAPGVAVERRMAERYALRLGDTVTVAPAPNAARRSFVVRAIYQPKADPATALRADYRIRLHLPDLADLLGRPDRVDRFSVRTAPGVSTDSAVRRLNQLAFGYRAYPSDEIARESSRTFAVVSRFHRAIGFIAIVASAIFLLCIMLLKVEERRLDAGVMRMIGISGRTIVSAVVLEACLVAIVGSLFGVVLAGLADAITNWVYQRRFDTELTFAWLTPGIVATGVGISLGLGVVAGFLAAMRLIRVRPLALWRRA